MSTQATVPKFQLVRPYIWMRNGGYQFDTPRIVINGQYNQYKEIASYDNFTEVVTALSLSAQLKGVRVKPEEFKLIAVFNKRLIHNDKLSPQEITIIPTHYKTNEYYKNKVNFDLTEEMYIRLIQEKNIDNVLFTPKKIGWLKASLLQIFVPNDDFLAPLNDISNSKAEPIIPIQSENATEITSLKSSNLDINLDMLNPTVFRIPTSKSAESLTFGISDIEQLEEEFNTSPYPLLDMSKKKDANGKPIAYVIDSEYPELRVIYDENKPIECQFPFDLGYNDFPSSIVLNNNAQKDDKDTFNTSELSQKLPVKSKEKRVQQKINHLRKKSNSVFSDLLVKCKSYGRKNRKLLIWVMGLTTATLVGAAMYSTRIFNPTPPPIASLPAQSNNTSPHNIKGTPEVEIKPSETPSPVEVKIPVVVPATSPSIDTPVVPSVVPSVFPSVVPLPALSLIPQTSNPPVSTPDSKETSVPEANINPLPTSDTVLITSFDKIVNNHTPQTSTVCLDLSIPPTPENYNQGIASKWYNIDKAKYSACKIDNIIKNSKVIQNIAQLNQYKSQNFQQLSDLNSSISYWYNNALKYSSISSPEIFGPSF